MVNIFIRVYVIIEVSQIYENWRNLKGNLLFLDFLNIDVIHSVILFLFYLNTSRWKEK